MTSWQERAEQAKQLSQQNKATKGTVDSDIKLDLREIERKRKEHAIQMLSRFDQFNIKGVLEDVNKTTPDVWGGLGEISQGELWTGRWDIPAQWPRSADSDLLVTSYDLKLGGHYKRMVRRRDSIDGMRVGWYYEVTGGGESISHGEVSYAHSSLKKRFGKHKEAIGFQEVVTEKEEEDRGLLVVVSYFSEHDSYDIYIDDREVNLNWEIRHNPIKHGSESAGYYKYSKDHTYLPTWAKYDPSNQHESGISLSFEAKFFDGKIDIVKSFLETSLLISTYLRRGSGHSLVERAKIMPPVISSPVYYPEDKRKE